MRLTINLILLTLVPSLALGSMMAMRNLPIKRVIAHIEKQKGHGWDTELVWAKLARDAFDVKEVALPDAQSDEASLTLLNTFPMAGQVSHSIRHLAVWNKEMPKQLKSLIQKNRSSLESSLESLPWKPEGQKSEVWPWFQAQLGEKAEAKKTLLVLYSVNFEKVMKLKEAVTGLDGGTPLSLVEYLLKALETLCTAEELADLRAKMQKMKVHVSTLPQSMIMT